MAVIDNNQENYWYYFTKCGDYVTPERAFQIYILVLSAKKTENKCHLQKLHGDGRMVCTVATKVICTYRMLKKFLYSRKTFTSIYIHVLSFTYNTYNTILYLTLCRQ
jgi:hypothetical protein